MPRTDPAPIDDQVLTALRDGLRFLSRLATTLWLVCGFLLITVGSITHEMLFAPEGTLSLPLFDVPVSPRGFFIFAPSLLICLHAYMLLERLRFALRLCRVLPELPADGQPPQIFLPSFVLRGLAGRGLPWDIWTVVGIGFFVLTLTPIGLLLLIQRAQLPGHDSVLLLFHQICVTGDLILICYFVLRTYWISRCRASRFLPGLLRRLLALLMIAVLSVYVSWCWLTLPGDGDTGSQWANDHLRLRRWDGSVSRTTDSRFRPAIRDMAYADMAGIKLPGADLRDLNLRHADLSDSDLKGADLRQAALDGADLSNADLRGANLTGASLQKARLDDARLDGALLVGAHLEGTRARKTVFFAADLSQARLVGADLSEADFRLAHLSGAWLRAARFVGASLHGVVLPDRALGLDLRGAALPWAIGLEPVHVDLRHADLRHSALLCAGELEADIRGATLGGAVPEGEAIDDLRREIENELTRFEADAGSDITGPWVRESINRATAHWRRVQSTQSCPLDPQTTLTGLVVDGQPSHPNVLTPEGLYSDIGHELAIRACDDLFVAEMLAGKSLGEWLPRDPASEAAYASATLAVLKGDCPAMGEAVGDEDEFSARVCQRWRGDPRIAESCPGAADQP